MNALGREYLEKLSRHEVKVQNIVPAALANLVISGEVPLSPTIQDSNIFTAKKAGAPVEWRPLEPVMANLGSLEQRFKKSYLETQYSPEEMDKKFSEWQELMRQLFVRKR